MFIIAFLRLSSYSLKSNSLLLCASVLLRINILTVLFNILIKGKEIMKRFTIATIFAAIAIMAPGLATAATETSYTSDLTPQVTTVVVN